jgi:hypothetical protein
LGGKEGKLALQHEINHTLALTCDQRQLHWRGAQPEKEVVRQRHLLHPLLLRNYSKSQCKVTYERGPQHSKRGDEILETAAILQLGDAVLAAGVEWNPALAVKDWYYGLAHHTLTRGYSAGAVRKALNADDFKERYLQARQARAAAAAPATAAFAATSPAAAAFAAAPAAAASPSQQQTKPEPLPTVESVQHSS